MILCLQIIRVTEGLWSYLTGLDFFLCLCYLPLQKQIKICIDRMVFDSSKLCCFIRPIPSAFFTSPFMLLCLIHTSVSSMGYSGITQFCFLLGFPNGILKKHSGAHLILRAQCWSRDCQRSVNQLFSNPANSVLFGLYKLCLESHLEVILRSNVFFFWLLKRQIFFYFKHLLCELFF